MGVTQEFLNVGGDSIQVGQIRAKVEDEFGVELSFIDFFGSPTVRDLSGVIDNMLAERHTIKPESMLSITIPSS